MKMTNDDPFHELLVRYLSNQVSDQERAEVEAWLNTDDNNRRLLQQWQNVDRLAAIDRAVSSIDLDAEWKNLSEKMEEEPTLETVKMPRRYGRLVTWAAAAAVLALVATLGIRLNRQQKTGSAQQELVNSNKPADTLYQLTRYESNRSGQVKKLALSDGTSILLDNNSELTFLDAFEADRRVINLAGTADFQVAKDSSRPFSVISGDLSVTALGTRFVVNNRPDDKNITVQLLEGKVVIRSSEQAKEKMSREFFLVAGQELIYDREKYSAIARKIPAGKSRVNGGSSADLPGDNPAIPSNTKGNWYMFNNESLPQVFKQLESMYGVTIVFKEADVRNKYFIGTFDKSTPLEKILKQIVLLNNLKMTTEKDKFIITQ